MPARYQEGRLVQAGLCWAYLPQDEMLKDMPYYGGCGDEADDLHFTTAHQVALHVVLTTRREWGLNESKQTPPKSPLPRLRTPWRSRKL